ncbi:MAG TPA: hypothetical protein VIX19_08995 [Terriglobales bacterium]
MSRLALFFAFLMSVTGAQAQLFSGAPPASATSPTADGRTHGAPASVLSPKVPPFVPGHGPGFVNPVPFRPFGTGRHRDVFIPVPLFYPIYNPGLDSAYPSAADPSVPEANDPATADSAGNVGDSEDALRQAYLQGVRDAISQQASSRYGQHYMDSRESLRAKGSSPSGDSATPSSASAPKADPQPVADDTPLTVFIFKNGRQIETRNYAIMGQTLYDFSSPNLRKVQLTDLDKAATAKANDDRGVIVKLP